MIDDNRREAMSVYAAMRGPRCNNNNNNRTTRFDNNDEMKKNVCRRGPRCSNSVGDGKSAVVVTVIASSSSSHRLPQRRPHRPLLAAQPSALLSSSPMPSLLRLVSLMLLLSSSSYCDYAHGWVSAPPPTALLAKTTTTTTRRGRASPPPPLVVLWATKNDKRNDDDNDGTSSGTTTAADVRPVADDPDLPPVMVEGAQFFGGSKQKEEFYDPEAEAAAGEELKMRLRKAAAELSSSLKGATANATASVSSSSPLLVLDRFLNRDAFDTDVAADVARSVQAMANQVLYGDSERTTTSDSDRQQQLYAYAPDVEWMSPFSSAAKSTSPLSALQYAKQFYRRIDVAVTGGRQVQGGSSSSSSLSVAAMTIELCWEISVVWPTLWEPRVLVTGTSQLTIDDDNDTKRILAQVDRPDNDSDGYIVSQLLPRFWDVYHIGMTPSSEMSPKLIAKKTGSLFSNYELYTLPARWYWSPSQLDLGTREDSNAATVPNHAFTTVIKTMGPQKQEYVPVSPVQVSLVPAKGGSGLRLEWLIPIAVNTLALNTDLLIPSPGADEDVDPEEQAECRYVWVDRRQVATVPYGGSPQDAEITDVRKKLYEQVVKDGLKPKLDESGRPKFFFWQNSVKACYTDEGLGMAVYEWRPKFSKPSAVGIELENTIQLQK